MESVKNLYKIGLGPSSSHTMGPLRAAKDFVERHLGLTCDPVNGLVQIPCVERNAFAAARAMDANLYASLSDGVHRVSFDKVIKTMLQTGRDMPSLYRETSTGGLATTF